MSLTRVSFIDYVNKICEKLKNMPNMIENI